jgi:O-antigen/teichoic acid export membrane protein
MMTHFTKAKELILGSSTRSRKANKNILFSFFIKGYAMFIQFALVPLTLHYLDKAQYGLWLVLASILEWFSHFDIGIGHGLRNKLSEALARNDTRLARTFISTGYTMVSIIFLSFIFIFALVNPFLDWSAILNVPPGVGSDIRNTGKELNETVMFVFAFFCIRFILSMLTAVLYAKQEPALNNVIGPLGSTLSLILIFVLSKFVKGSLFWVALIFSGAPLLIFLIFTIVLFSTRYRTLMPAPRFVDFSYSRQLLGLGVNFFIIHISMLVLFSSANMVLTRLFGPEEVTVYNIAYRYFTIALLVNGIVTLTYWSPFTEAFVKKDFAWIRNAIKRLEIVSFLLIGVLVVSALVADPAIRLWVGSSIDVPGSMKIALVVYVIIQLLAAPFNIFINGASKVRLQLYMAIVSIIVTIPLAILFAKVLGFGPAGVVMAMICSTLPTSILWRIQYHKLINEKATGIWNK